MNFGFTAEQHEFRAEVRRRLLAPTVRSALAQLREQGVREPDPRPLYEVLGATGLLAVHWPADCGGAGKSFAEAAIVAEELVRCGLPDTPHVNTIQIVGQFILMAGTDEQRRRYLPELAAGRQLAAVLYTEPGAGSDLGSLAAVAEPDGAGYRITGTKVYSLTTRFAGLGLCAARTGQEASRYQGISLFLVDLTGPGVRVSTIPTAAPEQFHRVELDGARVPLDGRLGAEGAGWGLLSSALAVERTGLDYALKAERWLAAALEVVGQGPPEGRDAAVLEAIGRYGARLTAGQVLAWQVLNQILAGRPDETMAAAAKYHTSELAAEVAAWAGPLPDAGQRAAGGVLGNRAAELASAYLEGPGLTLSAGTSEVMLQVVSASFDSFGREVD